MASRNVANAYFEITITVISPFLFRNDKVVVSEIGWCENALMPLCTYTTPSEARKTFSLNVTN